MTDSKQDKKRDEVLKRMLNTPPKPHKQRREERREKDRQRKS